jgi:hypothetical protein
LKLFAFFSVIVSLSTPEDNVVLTGYYRFFLAEKKYGHG